MGFFSSIFGGSSPTLNQNIPAFQQEAGFATGIGNNDVNASSKWYNDILSGDESKISQALAPETSAIQGQAQQEKNTTAQFSPRSGGTAAQISGLDANTRAQLIKLLGGLKGGAAGSLAGIGENEQGLGISSREAADAASKQQMEDWANSILGRGITGAAATAESAGLDAGFPGASTSSFG